MTDDRHILRSNVADGAKFPSASTVAQMLTIDVWNSCRTLRRSTLLLRELVSERTFSKRAVGQPPHTLLG
jgi:hypothetical protein